MTNDLKRISDKIIYFYRKKYNENITPIKLQYLCYYAQGIYMLKNEKALFKEDFYAFEQGPIIEELNLKYNNLEWRGIGKEIEKIEVNELEDELLFQVISTFGSYESSELLNIIKEESPWQDTFQKIDVDTFVLKKEILISKESMFKYFKKRRTL